MRFMFVATLGLGLVGCNNVTTSEQWREVRPTSKDSRFERAKAICNGRAGETQAMSGRYWIAGAIASSSTFKACMAEQGFVQ